MTDLVVEPFRTGATLSKMLNIASANPGEIGWSVILQLIYTCPYAGFKIEVFVHASKVNWTVLLQAFLEKLAKQPYVFSLILDMLKDGQRTPDSSSQLYNKTNFVTYIW